MLRDVLAAMPTHNKHAILHHPGMPYADILFQALVGAGPGTDAGKAFALQSVVPKGGPVAARAVYPLRRGRRRKCPTMGWHFFTASSRPGGGHLRCVSGTLGVRRWTRIWERL